LKAVCPIVLSSVETVGAFITGFDTVNLHRPTFIYSPMWLSNVVRYSMSSCTNSRVLGKYVSKAMVTDTLIWWRTLQLKLKAKFESGSSYYEKVRQSVTSEAKQSKAWTNHRLGTL
jgi:hypothetical protein